MEKQGVSFSTSDVCQDKTKFSYVTNAIASGSFGEESGFLLIWGMVKTKELVTSIQSNVTSYTAWLENIILLDL